MILRTSGAGGYGDPLDREPSAVLADVRSGLVSSAAAEQDYGVVVRAEDVDETATREQRARRRAGGGFDLGVERRGWDQVLPASDYDLFVSALMEHPRTERSSLRERALSAVLAHLPDSFPAANVSPSTIERAREEFRAQVNKLLR